MLLENCFRFFFSFHFIGLRSLFSLLACSLPVVSYFIFIFASFQFCMVSSPCTVWMRTMNIYSMFTPKIIYEKKTKYKIYIFFSLFKFLISDDQERQVNVRMKKWNGTKFEYVRDNVVYLHICAHLCVVCIVLYLLVIFYRWVVEVPNTLPHLPIVLFSCVFSFLFVLEQKWNGRSFYSSSPMLK